MKILCSAIVLLLFLGECFSSSAQDYDGHKGFTAYQKYDNSYITPSFRGKHSVSIGVNGAITSPIMEFNPLIGGHLGYNYLILYKRKRFFAIKEIVRDEVKMGFGVHLTFLQNKEFFVMANYLNPFFSLRGKLLSFYFFNEVGIGLHSAPKMEQFDKRLGFNISLEPLRIRFGKSPLHIHLTANYDTSNDLLGKERLGMSFMAGLRYYIYRKK